MERYNIIAEVGNGSFGSVWRAINKQTGEVVAVKKMKKKYFLWQECLNLREVKCLRKLNHPNIVKLKELIREHDVLYFIFEYMEFSLYQVMTSRLKRPFSENEVRNLCFQVFQGLAYMHQRGYFHRDLKPENLLVTRDTIKIADFGLAREVDSEPPYTQYVSTRWYRAPEVLLKSSYYGASVDMWAMGAIMAELFTLRPLFPGSSEADEVDKICSVIGSPTLFSWSEGLNLGETLGYKFPLYSGMDLSTLIPSASGNAINLISSLCSWDPRRRPTAVEALQHPFFQSCFYIPPTPRIRDSSIRPPHTVRRGFYNQNVHRRYPGVISNPKVLGNCSSPNLHTPAPEAAAVQRKVEPGGEVESGAAVRMVTQPKYKPPPRNSYHGPNNGKVWGSGGGAGRVEDVTERFGKMGVKCYPERRQQEETAGLVAAMKAGGWAEPVMVGGGRQEVRPTRRRVA